MALEQKSMPKPHISVTQINTYIRCPLQYKFRYLDGLILPPRAALTKGKSVHKGVEHNYTQKIESHEDVKLSEVQEVVAAEFETLATETEFEKDEEPGKIKDDTVSLATLYHKEVAPTVQPIMVEKKVEVKFENASYNLLGYIDVIDDKDYIRDTKTTGRTPPESDVHKSLQLTAYSMSYRTLYGKEEAGVKLDYLVQTKIPKTVQFESKRTERDIERFLKTMGMVAHAIQNNIFFPNENNFLCSAEKCGYWSMCHSNKW